MSKDPLREEEERIDELTEEAQDATESMQEAYNQRDRGRGRGGPQDVPEGESMQDAYDRQQSVSVGEFIAENGRLIALMVGGSIFGMFLLLYVRQAVPIMMALGGIFFAVITTYESDINHESLLMSTMSIIVFIIWGISTANAVLSVLAGQFMNLGFLGIAILAVGSTIHVVANGDQLLKASFNFFNLLETAEQAGARMLGFAGAVGLLLGITLALDLFALAPRGLVTFMYVFVGLMSPVSFYWSIREGHTSHVAGRVAQGAAGAAQRGAARVNQARANRAQGKWIQALEELEQHNIADEAGVDERTFESARDAIQNNDVSRAERRMERIINNIERSGNLEGDEQQYLKEMRGRLRKWLDQYQEVQQ